jgi:uncharacterized membrane protein
MIDGWLFVLTLVAALGCGVMAGVFFAFSSFVMRALARLPSAAGIRAMQSINVEAPTPWFMVGLLGTAAVCVAVAVTSLVRWSEEYAVFLLVGSLLYLVGTIVLTVVYHVPRNDALATVDPESRDAEHRWDRYVAGWTAWNHVRAAAALAAAATLTGALRIG